MGVVCTFCLGPSYTVVQSEDFGRVFKHVLPSSLKKINGSKWGTKNVTLPKTNMEPENHLFEKENHLPNLHVNFRGSIGFWFQWLQMGKEVLDSKSKIEVVCTFCSVGWNLDILKKI